MKLKFISIILLIFVCMGCDHKQKIAEFATQADRALENDNYELAIKDYSEAIRLNPKYAAAYTARGDALMILGENDKAMHDFSEAIQLNPNDYLAYELRGTVYYANQQFEKAINDLNFALKNESSNPKLLKSHGQAYKIRGLCYYWTYSFTNAIADLTEAAKYLPDDYEIYERRGDCYDRRTDADKALNDFNKAIQLNSEDWMSLYCRGSIYSHTGKYTNAIQDFEKTIQLEPQSRKANNLLAWLLATCPDDKIRNGKRAVDLATKVCEMSGWTNYAYVDTLAAAYAETGDFDQAVKYQKQAASINSIPEGNRTNVENRVQLYLQHKPYRELKTYKVSN